MLTTHTKPTIVGFDYSTLPPDVAKAARIAADRIRDRITGNTIKIGRELLTMKERLNNGQFGAWVLAEFGMVQRTAQRYMATARLSAKCDLVADLSPAALDLLSAPTTP